MRHKSPLLAIIFTVFIDLLGVGIVIPVVAPLLLNPAHGILGSGVSFSQRTMTIGLLTATFALAQFFSAPILGALSDRHGRRKLLMVCILGTAGGYLMFAAGVLKASLVLLFIGRIIDGLTGGNISIAMSAIADISDEKTKPKNFGLVGMAFGLGFIIGPFLGGKLSDPNILPWFGFHTPFLAAAILCFLNIFLVYFNFPETLKKSVAREVSLFTGLRNLRRAFSSPNFRAMFTVVFLFTFGFTLYTQFLQVFFYEKFLWTQSQIGDYFAYVGIWIAITQGVINRQISRKYSPGQVLGFSLFGLAFSMLATFLPSQAWMLFLFSPFLAIFNGLASPNSTTIVSNLADEHSQGEILGLNQSVQSFAQAIPPLIGGVLAGHNAGYPILASFFVTLLAWAVFMARAKHTTKF